MNGTRREIKLTRDDQAAFGGAQAGFTGEAVFGATLVRFLTIFGADVFDVKFPRRQYEVFAI